MAQFTKATIAREHLYKKEFDKGVEEDITQDEDKAQEQGDAELMRLLSEIHATMEK